MDYKNEIKSIVQLWVKSLSVFIFILFAINGSLIISSYFMEIAKIDPIPSSRFVNVVIGLFLKSLLDSYIYSIMLHRIYTIKYKMNKSYLENFSAISTWKLTSVVFISFILNFQSSRFTTNYFILDLIRIMLPMLFVFYSLFKFKLTFKILAKLTLFSPFILLQGMVYYVLKGYHLKPILKWVMFGSTTFLYITFLGVILSSVIDITERK